MGPNFLKSCGLCVCVCLELESIRCGIFLKKIGQYEMFFIKSTNTFPLHTVLFEDLDLKSFSTT